MAAINELKLKSKVENLDAVRERVKSLAKFIGRKEFTDYFFYCDKDSGYELRLRKLGEKKTITLKLLKHRNDVQENVEYEFAVDNADDFIGFLEYLGFKPSCMLRKSSESFKHDDVSIELATVEHLGCFVELVICTKDELTEEHEKQLKELAAKLGLKAIDSRYYPEIKKEIEQL
ncbi:MAG: class IV adenylate cyclase [Candidatus Woesearchaeota archaeon]